MLFSLILPFYSISTIQCSVCAKQVAVTVDAQCYKTCLIYDTPTSQFNLSGQIQNMVSFGY